jgi:hypothetical protein
VDKTVNKFQGSRKVGGQKEIHEGSKSRSLKEAKPPSVAPGGILGIRALVFFRIVTFERRVAEGRRVVERLETSKGLGSSVSTDLGM